MGLNVLPTDSLPRLHLAYKVLSTILECSTHVLQIGALRCILVQNDRTRRQTETPQIGRYRLIGAFVRSQ